MICEKPFVRGKTAHGCGSCLPCRIRKRAVWSHRMMLESSLYSDNCFVTLTYRQPEFGPPDMSLRPRDLQLFLKRLRKAHAPDRLRFYACGEYGEKSHLPHYHLAIFNFPTCQYGRSRFKRRQNCCASCDTIRDCWPHGFVDVGTLEINSAQYVAQYVTKKMTSKDDPRLDGRHPEFARMSNRPGIGHDAMHFIASQLLSVEHEGDVPSVLLHGRRPLPLGRYLTRKLRLFVTGKEDLPDDVVLAIEEKLRPMREAAFSAPVAWGKEKIFSNLLADAAAPKIASMKSRAAIFKKGSL